MISPLECKVRGRKKKSENKKFFDLLRKRSPKNLDLIMQTIHNQVFQDIDCLECANCCKTLGPRITQRDISRLAKYMGLSQSLFITRYLRVDEDGDFVFQSMPCPFLRTDNHCSVYDFRPDACREYPHTNQRNFLKNLPITLLNIEYCPAVYESIERLKKQIVF